MKSRLIVLLIIALLILVEPAKVVLALSEPDSVSIDDIEIFTNLITTGDFLAIVPYSIPFTSAPDEGIDQTFIFRLLSADGSTENGTALATPLFNNGYGDGIVSFYFTSGMEWGESYLFRVQENPTYYPSAQYWDFSTGNATYSSASDQVAALKAKILDSATHLTTEFDTQLLATSESGSTVLSTYGELYYLTAVPGLQTMCPTLFSVQLENPDYTKRTWQTTFANTLQTKYSGTFIYDFMTGFGGLFSTDVPATMAVVSIIAIAVVMAVSVWKFKASMLSAFVDGYCVIILLMLMGFFPMIAAGALAFFSVVLGGVILFLNRA